MNKKLLYTKPLNHCRVEQTYISDYLQKKYSALDGALGS